MSNDPIRDRLNYPQCFPTGEDIMDAYQRPMKKPQQSEKSYVSYVYFKSRVDDIDGIAEEICEYLRQSELRMGPTRKGHPRTAS